MDFICKFNFNIIKIKLIFMKKKIVPHKAIKLNIFVKYDINFVFKIFFKIFFNSNFSITKFF